MEFSIGNSVGKSVGKKNIITEGYTDEMKRVILFFLFLMDLPTDKKLPMNNSLTQYFRR
jgi:hypothetical protein